MKIFFRNILNPLMPKNPKRHTLKIIQRMILNLIINLESGGFCKVRMTILEH